jgi:hypothetical protein
MSGRPGRHVIGRYGVGTLWCVRASDAFVIQFNAINIAKRPLKGGAWIALEEGWKVTPCGRRSNPRSVEQQLRRSRLTQWRRWQMTRAPAETEVSSLGEVALAPRPGHNEKPAGSSSWLGRSLPARRVERNPKVLREGRDTGLETHDEVRWAEAIGAFDLRLRDGGLTPLNTTTIWER